MLSEKSFTEFYTKNFVNPDVLDDFTDFAKPGFTPLSGWSWVPPAINRVVDNIGNFFGNASEVGSNLPNTVYQPIVTGAASGISGYLQNPENIGGLVNAGIASQTGGLGGLGGLFGGLTGRNNQPGNQGGIDPIILLAGAGLAIYLITRK
jgi:hypothetical protein